MNKLKPICVDLDGTLIKNDVTIDATKMFVKLDLKNIFYVFAWFLRGRAYLKRMLASKIELKSLTLEYNRKLLDFLLLKKKEGHSIILATACDMMYARQIAIDLNIFDKVFASDGNINLREKAKAKKLVSEFGENGFIYIGNSKDDVYVWNKSAESILVMPTKSALRKMKKKQYTLFRE